MRLYRLRTRQTVRKAREEVFPFFARPENLSLITPASLDFRLLTPGPIDMERGRLIDYTIRLSGIRVRWRTLITAYDPPRHFVDEQIRGPYSFWHHAHTFVEESGGTTLLDDVHYALPLGLPPPLSRAMHRLYVRPQLEHIFSFRRQVIARTFGAAGEAPESPIQHDEIRV